MPSKFAHNITSKDLIGQEVRIFPGDTYSKQGIVVDIDEHGVLFRITKNDVDRTYIAGTLHFIAWSARLTFAELPFPNGG